MEAVRQAMATLGYDASPLEIQKNIKEQFDVEMTSSMISSYKSTLRNKAGMAGQRKKRGRPQKINDIAPMTATPEVVTFHDAVPWKDLRTIKDIAGRIGKKGLRELVALLD